MSVAKELELSKITRVGDALAISDAFRRLDPTIIVPQKIPPLYGEVSHQATQALSQACLSTVHPLALELAAGILSGKITQFVPPEPPAKVVRVRAKKKAKNRSKKRWPAKRTKKAHKK